MKLEQVFDLNIGDFIFIKGVKYFVKEFQEDDCILHLVQAIDNKPLCVDLQAQDVQSYLLSWSKNNAPVEAGVYWARTSALFNMIIQIRGEAPFLTLRGYDIYAGRIEHDMNPRVIVEWGPRIECPSVLHFSKG